ncbi:MAG: tetratricopeptide repeat protein [Planctomycetota bacterium]
MLYFNPFEQVHVRDGCGDVGQYDTEWGRVTERGDYTAAAAAFPRALEADPKDGAAYLGRGTAHCHTGDFQAALSDLDAAVSHLPARIECWLNRGYCHFRMGNHQLAIAD